jgi:hypothetical protein
VSERLGIAECIAWVVDKVRYLVQLVKDLVTLLPVLKEAAVAAIVLGLIALLVLLVLYLVYRMSPRIPLLNHNIDLEGYVDKMSGDLAAQMRALHAGRASPAGAWLARDAEFAGNAAVMWDSVGAMLSLGTFESDLMTYLQFSGALQSWDPASISDIRNNAPQLVDEDGEPSTEAFRKRFCVPMERFQKAVEALSYALEVRGEQLRYGPGASGAWGPEAVRIVTAVHESRMMLAQLPEINTMYMTRRKFMPAALWTLYYFPFVKQMLTKRIPAYWRSFGKRYTSRMTAGMEWWSRAGAMAMMIPCYSAYSDPQERARRCKRPEGFVPNSRETVVEEFMGLGSLFSTFKLIGTFFKNIIAVAIALGMLFVKFPIDPFGTIIGILTIWLGAIVGLLLTLIWLIMTVTGQFFILLFVIVTLWTVGFSILYTCWLVQICLLMAVPYFGLWLVDLVTGGLVVRLMRCENELTDWYKRGSFQDGNGYERFVPACLMPCKSRYRVSDSGCCCTPLPDYMPDLCPQQLIYGIYRSGDTAAGLTAKGPSTLARYSPPAGFSSKTLGVKKQMIRDAYSQKAEWYQRCKGALKDRDFINRHLCQNVDLLDLSDEARASMATACAESYCDYVPGGGGKASMTRDGYDPGAPGGGNSRTCGMLHAVSDQAEGAEGDTSNLFRLTLLMALLVISVLLCLVGMVMNSDKLLE